MSANREPHSLTPEDKDFIHRVADLYAPPPMTPLQRQAFGRTLEKRLTRSARVSFLRPVAVVVTTCIAVLVWFTMQRQEGVLPGGKPLSEVALVAPQDEATAVAEDATLLTYAYYDLDFYGEANEEESEDVEQFLPEEYEALALVLAFPDA